MPRQNAKCLTCYAIRVLPRHNANCRWISAIRELLMIYPGRTRNVISPYRVVISRSLLRTDNFVIYRNLFATFVPMFSTFPHLLYHPPQTKIFLCWPQSVTNGASKLKLKLFVRCLNFTSDCKQRDMSISQFHQ